MVVCERCRVPKRIGNARRITQRIVSKSSCLAILVRDARPVIFGVVDVVDSATQRVGGGRNASRGVIAVNERVPSRVSDGGLSGVWCVVCKCRRKSTPVLLGNHAAICVVRSARAIERWEA